MDRPQFRRAIAFALGSLVLALAAAAPPAVAAVPTGGPLAKTSDGKPRSVAVGFYAMTIQGLDQQNNSFYADFYMWFRWQGEG